MLKVEIDIETGERVFNAVLKSQYGDLSPNIGGCPMYSYDKEENQREFDKLKEAYHLVMEYNGIDFKELNKDE
jgi:VCBS repeat-containing protein